VILTDLAMPSEDGFMVLAAMRATFLKRGARVPIIAITAHGSSESRHRALQARFDLYLTKPVEVGKLTKLVSAILGSTPASAAVA
jgi:DNA-binding response OmpR family regulator